MCLIQPCAAVRKQNPEACYMLKYFFTEKSRPLLAYTTNFILGILKLLDTPFLFSIQTNTPEQMIHTQISGSCRLLCSLIGS